MPMRGGIVGDPVGCVHLLRLLMRKAELAGADGSEVAVSVAGSAHARDASVLAGVIASATGRRVLPVQSALAASIGAGNDITQSAPRLVCDVGAGITEVAAVADGRVLASSAARMGVRHYVHDAERAVRRVVRQLRRVLDDLPDRAAREAAAGPLLFVGGGALLPDLATRLSSACRTPVRVPDQPSYAVANGLGASVALQLAAA
jgi:actin-like ATPase involved in cell morphogenesis